MPNNTVKIVPYSERILPKLSANINKCIEFSENVEKDVALRMKNFRDIFIVFS